MTLIWKFCWMAGFAATITVCALTTPHAATATFAERFEAMHTPVTVIVIQVPAQQFEGRAYWNGFARHEEERT